MSLSQNIKRFRRAKGLSQECVADSLGMSQSTYSRIENCETACADRLVHIAQALETTPDVLRHYHILQTPDLPLLPADLQTMLNQKDNFIRYQDEQITALRQHISYLQAVWREYIGGGSLTK